MNDENKPEPATREAIQILTGREVSRLLRIGTDKVNGLIKRGELRGYLSGKGYMVPMREVIAYQERRMAELQTDVMRQREKFKKMAERRGKKS
jgi:excisionase family DNA binding protein